MASMLTLSTSIPSRGEPGTPMIIVFDNGDWDITAAREAYYTKGSAPSFHCMTSFIDFFIDLMFYFDLGDADDLDDMGEVTNLFLSEEVPTGGYFDPVMLIYQDGETDVMSREEAESIIRTDPDIGMNFIPASDLFDDLRKFHIDQLMFGDDYEPADDFNEDEDKEDI